MMGLMILMMTLIIGLFLAFGVVSTYWSNPIADLNAATVGSSLLGDYGLIASFKFWLGPLRMMGMSFLFVSITIALTVIINTLKLQVNILRDFKAKAKQK